MNHVFIRRGMPLFDQMLVSGGNFLTIAICARFLPLHEQGKFTYIFASYLALLLLNISAIFQGASVRAPEEANKKNYLSVLAGAQVLIALKFSLITSLFFFFCGELIGWMPSTNEALLMLIFLFLQQLADFDRRISYIFFSSHRAVISSALMYPLRLLLIIYVKPDNVSTLLVLLIISTLLPICITIKRGMPGIFSKANLSSMLHHFNFSKLLVASAPLGWLWSFFPIFVLGTIHSREEVAILASIRSLSNVANILMEQMETVVAAKFGRTLHEEGHNSLNLLSWKLLIYGSLLWLTGFIIISLYGKEIVWLVLGKKYSDFHLVLWITWLAYGVFFLARVVGLKQRIFKNLWIEVSGNMGGVLIVLIASYPIIKSFGLYGAAWMYVICAFAILIMQLSTIKVMTYKSNHN